MKLLLVIIYKFLTFITKVVGSLGIVIHEFSS